MRLPYLIPLILLTGSVVAQTAPPPCPADRPVDDIISETNKQQSNRKTRNKNPLPDNICLWSWCRETRKERTPPTVPESAPSTETRSPSSDTHSPANQNAGGSSSKTADSACDLAMDRALQAAHDTDAGDFDFHEKNYRGALMRYRLAAENKPADCSIHVRLGRAYEHLHDSASAVNEYEAAQNLNCPEKPSKDAASALQRLRKEPGH